jgi:hypothetical protein
VNPKLFLKVFRETLEASRRELERNPALFRQRPAHTVAASEGVISLKRSGEEAGQVVLAGLSEVPCFPE